MAENGSRKIRLGMVGGGTGAFIGYVHRIAARLDGDYELVAGAMSSRPEVARESGKNIGLATDRIYTSYEEMAKKSVVKRLTKTAPLKSQRLFAALATDAENDAADVIDVTDDAPPADPPKRAKRTDELKSKMAAEHQAESARQAAVDGAERIAATTANPEVKAAAEAVIAAAKSTQAMITDEQKSKIRTMCDRGGAKKTGEVLTMVASVLALKDLESLSDLTAKQADIAIDVISGAKAMRDAEAKAAAAGEPDPSLGVDR